MGETQRKVSSGQIRFMSPERGVLQLATNAVLNAVWDLWAKAEGKPLWRLVADFTPEEFIRTMDFRYITDVLTPEEALEMLKHKSQTKEERIQLALQNEAVPAYNTSAGWLGHSDDKVSLFRLQIRGPNMVFLSSYETNKKNRYASCSKAQWRKDFVTLNSRQALVSRPIGSDWALFVRLSATSAS